MAEMENTSRLADDSLNRVDGGYAEAAVQCDCPSCGNRVNPSIRGGKKFCPVCGVQLGGVLNSSLF